MEWHYHDKWNRKLGISDGISNYVNNLIDVLVGRKTLPQEYLDFVELESQKEANSEKKVVSSALEEEILKHDSARKSDNKSMRELIAKIQLKFLSQKGEDYVKAWYLHHALDYVDDTIEWRTNTAETVEECVDKHQKNKPETYSPEIMDLLKNNIQELEKDLNP